MVIECLFDGRDLPGTDSGSLEQELDELKEVLRLGGGTVDQAAGALTKLARGRTEQ